MSMRTTARTVVFRHPFVLGGFERVEPAGSYFIQTEEEEMDGTTAAVSVWLRTATVMHIHHAGMTEAVQVDPSDLEAALARDAGPEETLAALMARLKADPVKTNASAMRRRML